MISLKFHFPAHRYHATPWGHHVNEAQVDWPPDPWRILRALIATWRRKLDPSGKELREEMRGLLVALSSELPLYSLPPVTAMHTRHYMPVRDGKKDKPVLIFDAAVHVAEGLPLTVVWPVDLDEEQRNLLHRLVINLGYLGRAESWVEVSVEESVMNQKTDCVPVGHLGSFAHPNTVEQLGESLKFLVPRTPENYQKFRQKTIDSMPLMKPREKKQFLKTLPEEWMDALCVETGDLHAAGWSAPPGAKVAWYSRSAPEAEGGRRMNLRKPSHKSGLPTTLRYALVSKPLPALEQAVRVGEWARMGAMGRAGKILGKDQIPWQLSGHGTPEGNRHEHAFFLPEDADGDGRIDHLIIHVPAGLEGGIEKVLRGLSYLKDNRGSQIQLLFEGLGSRELLGGSTSLLSSSIEWISVTPYLYPWYLKLKKSMGSNERGKSAQCQIEAQIRRECRERGLPEPESIEEILEVSIGGRPRRPIHFHRFRKKRGLVQPDRLGRFLRLRFPSPVSGPLALGFGCHFGLGLFRPFE